MFYAPPYPYSTAGPAPQRQFSRAEYRAAALFIAACWLVIIGGALILPR